MIHYRSPTGFGFRGADSYGDGAYGASREKKCPDCPKPGNKKCTICAGAGFYQYEHKGLDFKSDPPGPVYCPMPSELIRVGWAYPGDLRYRLVVLAASEDPGVIMKLLYLDPKDTLPGETYETGDVIGISQDLRFRYPADANHAQAITPHVHLEVREKGILIDPTNFLLPAEIE